MEMPGLASFISRDDVAALLEDHRNRTLSQLGSLVPHNVWRDIKTFRSDESDYDDDEVEFESPGIHLLYSSGWHPPVCHFRNDKGRWSDEECVALGGDMWYIHIDIEQRATDSSTELVVCEKSHTNWDNKPGGENRNYKIDEKGVYLLRDGQLRRLKHWSNVGVVDLLYGIDQAARLAKGTHIIYFTGWTTPHIHFNQPKGGWTTSPGFRCAKFGADGVFHAAVPSHGLEFVFNDGEGCWDHAFGGCNYVLREPGIYFIFDGAVLRPADLHQRDYLFRLVSLGVDDALKKASSPTSKRSSTEAVSPSSASTRASTQSPSLPPTSPPASPPQSPGSSRLPAGLVNLNNTCFLNASLQCFAGIPSFANGLRDKVTTNSPKLTRSFAKVLNDLSRIPRPHPAFECTGLHAKLRSVAPYLFDANQQDAHECVRVLLDQLHEGLKKALGPPCLTCQSELERGLQQGFASVEQAAHTWWMYYLNGDSMHMRTLVNELSMGQLHSRVKCTVCGRFSDTFEPFLDLSLPLARSSQTVSLFSCVESYFAQETLEGKEVNRATKQLSVTHAPEMLFLHIKRFSSSLSKVHTPLDFPMRLENELATRFFCGAEYDLLGLVRHIGQHQAGHYMAYVLRDGRWYCFDDDRVHLVSTGMRQTSIAQMYVRMGGCRRCAAD
ncbi:unnamed protein product [Vitrella brassicaformis CCMP3155]|uniref:USP domain-containing protein n=1 Tax=Vitrella brassicaformis (strain CCMP3155) TaxID=1169540 RepID=A0A0G4EXI9_VITBC|nr:unnamed protein product [Vitrella brassicaformis CCMP3155]|eukprot:CEM03528.1 unnamed protein product [Vitrella brassicaformis CCMP3155]